MNKVILRDAYVVGIFTGALLMCLMMLLFPAKQRCVVEIGKGNVTHVMVGDYDE